MRLPFALRGEMNYWKVFCEETENPGLWPRWFKEQCAAVGWNPHRGWSMEGKAQKQDWATARNYLTQIAAGDMLLVQLKHNRVGRVGEVIRKEVDDEQWNPTVPSSKTHPWGRLGRRIAVRWKLNVGPTDPDMVVSLPRANRLASNLALGTIRRLDRKTFSRVIKAMEDKINWVNLQGRFDYERSLSDWIATYPHRLEDELMPYPDAKVREKAFPDKTRSDVLLIDANGTPVVVECKQGSPTLDNIKQLQNYMNHIRKIARKRPRGILVHGGATSLRDDVRRKIKHDPLLKVLRYSLNVDFVPSA
jgi:hypothetical protein